eukprot:g212.t1
MERALAPPGTREAFTQCHHCSLRKLTEMRVRLRSYRSHANCCRPSFQQPFSTATATPQLDLAGKSALVTGGSGDIGSAIARALAQKGANVTLASRCEERARTALARLARADGQQHGWLQLDVSDAEQVRHALNGDRKHGPGGRLGFDVVVNAAGLAKDSLLVNMPDREMREMVEVHLLGSMHVARAVAKPMIRNKGGRIIFIGSVVGSQGHVGQAAYSAAKAGLVGLTKSLAKELGSRGVTVNLIAPGFMAGEMTGQIRDDKRDQIKQKIPLGRLGCPDDVAQLACFLAGPGGSYITGQTLAVDVELRPNAQPGPSRASELPPDINKILR